VIPFRYGNEDWQLRMGDQLEAIAAAGDPISVSPFDLDPGAPPVGFETIARIRQNRSRGWTKPFWGTHETALKQSGRKPPCKEGRFGHREA
jgi:hypothetical protein